jgi:hypothetical protein
VTSTTNQNIPKARRASHTSRVPAHPTGLQHDLTIGSGVTGHWRVIRPALERFLTHPTPRVRIRVALRMAAPAAPMNGSLFAVSVGVDVRTANSALVHQFGSGRDRVSVTGSIERHRTHRSLVLAGSPGDCQISRRSSSSASCKADTRSSTPGKPEPRRQGPSPAARRPTTASCCIGASEALVIDSPRSRKRPSSIA